MFGSDGHYTGRAHGWVTGNRRTRYFRTNFFASFREEVMRGMNGFTLIELLVTLAILVIAVTVAMPSYSALVQRQQMTTAVNDMVHLLTFARQESMRRQKLVTVCPRDRKSTRLNSSHVKISYAVFCLK